METVKAREIFNKVKKFNELGEYLYQGRNELAIAFTDGLQECDFENYEDFSKFVRCIYVEVVAARLLNGEWNHDGEYFTIECLYNGYITVFELYVHTKR